MQQDQSSSSSQPSLRLLQSSSTSSPSEAHTNVNTADLLDSSINKNKELSTQASLVASLTCTGRYKPSPPPLSLAKQHGKVLTLGEDGGDGSSIDLAFRSFVMAAHTMQSLEIQPSNVPLALEPFVDVASEGGPLIYSFPHRDLLFPPPPFSCIHPVLFPPPSPSLPSSSASISILHKRLLHDRYCSSLPLSCAN